MLTELTWQVESLRFTLFQHPEQQPSFGLWQQITGQAPTNRMERPLEGLFVEEGQWEDGQLTVSKRGDRMDILISPLPSHALKLPSIGEISTITKMLDKLLPNLQHDSACRIAFGAVFLQPTAGHKKAYQTLAKLLPNLHIDPQSRDFFYQINWPIKSKSMPNIEINRLRRWSAIVMQILNMGDPLNKRELFAVRLELDINTNTTETNLITKDNALLLWRELVEEGLYYLAGESK